MRVLSFLLLSLALIVPAAAMADPTEENSGGGVMSAGKPIEPIVTPSYDKKFKDIYKRQLEYGRMRPIFSQRLSQRQMSYSTPRDEIHRQWRTNMQALNVSRGAANERSGPNMPERPAPSLDADGND